MPDFGMLIQVLLPLAMFAGGIAAWRATKRGNEPRPDKPTWRDDSLDDWRIQREAEIEAERARRAAAGPESTTPESSTAGAQSKDTARHTRLGG